MQTSTDFKTIRAFLYAKQCVIQSGYSDEILWQESTNFNLIDEKTFLKEAAWVILNSGMRESLIRKLFSRISACFFKWESAERITKKKDYCIAKALSIFNNVGKIRAIATLAEDVYRKGIDRVKLEIRETGIDRIMCYPFMGKATSYHFAKNIGLDFAKPDRHLLRIAAVAGYECPLVMCQELAQEIGEKTSVVDLVFWRFATLDKDYLRIFGDA